MLFTYSQLLFPGMNTSESTEWTWVGGLWCDFHDDVIQLKTPNKFFALPNRCLCQVDGSMLLESENTDELHSWASSSSSRMNRATMVVTIISNFLAAYQKTTSSVNNFMILLSTSLSLPYTLILGWKQEATKGQPLPWKITFFGFFVHRYSAVHYAVTSENAGVERCKWS